MDTIICLIVVINSTIYIAPQQGVLEQICVDNTKLQRFNLKLVKQDQNVSRETVAMTRQVQAVPNEGDKLTNCLCM